MFMFLLAFAAHGRGLISGARQISREIYRCIVWARARANTDVTKAFPYRLKQTVWDRYYAKLRVLFSLFNNHFINTSYLLTFCFFGRRRRHFLLIAQPIMNILITKVTKVWLALVSRKLTGSDERTPFIPACTRHCLRHLKLTTALQIKLTHPDWLIRSRQCHRC